MAVQQKYFNLDLPTLELLQTAYAQGLANIATAGQTYHIGNRTYSRANITALADELKEVGAAIQAKRGRRVTSKAADLSCRDTLRTRRNGYGNGAGY